MATTNRLFDDFTRLVSDATGAAQGVRREVESAVKAQFERLIRDMDVATREELDVVRDMVVDLRRENEALKLRLAALEPKAAVSGAAAFGGDHRPGRYRVLRPASGPAPLSQPDAWPCPSALWTTGRIALNRRSPRRYIDRRPDSDFPGAARRTNRLSSVAGTRPHG
jgi:BMFP domain-containing protein YqiC